MPATEASSSTVAVLMSTVVEASDFASAASTTWPTLIATSSAAIQVATPARYCQLVIPTLMRCSFAMWRGRLGSGDGPVVTPPAGRRARVHWAGPGDRISVGGSRDPPTGFLGGGP